jgi:hypothetical protein
MLRIRPRGFSLSIKLCEYVFADSDLIAASS